MARVAPEVIQDILRKTDFVGTIGQYLVLRAQGRKFLALCPFHSEKTPSFHFDPETGIYHCFGCKAGGSFINLICELEKWTFPEAVRELGRRVGIEVQEMSAEERQRYDHKQRLREVLERASTLYHKLLMKSPDAQQARDYLKARGVTSATAATFEIGYAPAAAAFLIDWMQERGIASQDVIAAGLAVDRNGRAVDLFRDRVTFPIRDAHGQRIAMGARLLGDGQPKYLNSPETILFSKRAHLYGLYQARGAMRDTAAVVVEGYMDVIAMHQAGLTQTVASLGTALTLEQAKLLRRYCQSCVLAYDADTAGENATEKGIQVFEQAELSVRVLRLPAGEDPDSLLRRDGAPAVQALLAQAQGIVEHRMRALGERFNLRTAEGKSGFLREMIPTLSKIRDVVRLDAYIRSLCHQADVNETTVRKLLKVELPRSTSDPIPRTTAFRSEQTFRRNDGRAPKAGDGGHAPRDVRFHAGMRGGERRYTPRPAEPPPIAPAGRTASDRVRRATHDLLRYLLANPTYVPTARAAIKTDEIDDPLARTLLHHLYTHSDGQQPLAPADLIPLVEAASALQEGVDRKLSELLFSENAVPLTLELFTDTLRFFQRRREKAELHALKHSVKQRIGVSISPNDPDYIRLRELEQRLQNDGMKGS